MAQGRPRGTSHIDLRFSAEAMEVISDLHSGSHPRAILKIHPPSSLDYRARHGPQTIIVLNVTLNQLPFWGQERGVIFPS